MKIKLDPILSKIRKVIQSDFYCYFKHSNILAISEDKASLPFMIIMKENDHYGVSVAVDYPTGFNVAYILLHITPVHKLNLADSFYISQHTGLTYFGTEAGDQWDMDNLDISMAEPISKSLN